MNRTRKKWEDCKVFLMCTLLVLLLPFGFLFFFIPGKILDAIRMRQYRKRRERTRWQPPVPVKIFCGDVEFPRILRKRRPFGRTPDVSLASLRARARFRSPGATPASAGLG